MRRISLLALPLLLCSCAATTNYYDQAVTSWHGGSIKTLQKVWGSPDAIEKTPNEGKVYVYKTEDYQSYSTLGAAGAPAAGVHVDSTGRPVMTDTARTNDSAIPILNLTCSALFTANKYGTIIATDTQGNNCYGSENFLQKHKNPHSTR